MESDLGADVNTVNWFPIYKVHYKVKERLFGLVMQDVFKSSRLRVLSMLGVSYRVC